MLPSRLHQSHSLLDSSSTLYSTLASSLLFSLDGRLRRQRDTTTVANVGCATLQPHASAGVLCYRRPRRRRRRLAPAAADMGVSGGGTIPPSVARLCRWRDFATCVRWVLGWPGPTDAQWHSHVLCLALNTRAIQNLCAAAFQSQFCCGPDRPI